MTSTTGLRETLTAIRDALLSPINSGAIVDTMWMPGEPYPTETVIDFIDNALSASMAGPVPELVEAARMARTRLQRFADEANAGNVQAGGRELARQIWGAFAEFDALAASPAPALPEAPVAWRIWSDMQKGWIVVTTSTRPDGDGWQPLYTSPVQVEREAAIENLRGKLQHYAEKQREFADDPRLRERFAGLAVATSDALKLLGAEPRSLSRTEP